MRKECASKVWTAFDGSCADVMSSWIVEGARCLIDGITMFFIAFFFFRSGQSEVVLASVAPKCCKENIHMSIYRDQTYAFAISQLMCRFAQLTRRPTLFVELRGGIPPKLNGSASAPWCVINAGPGSHGRKEAGGSS